jgi:hypothetical protein
VRPSVVSPEMTNRRLSLSSRRSGADEDAPAGSPSQAIWTVEEYAHEVGCSTEELRRSVERLDTGPDCLRSRSEQVTDG